MITFAGPSPQPQQVWNYNPTLLTPQARAMFSQVIAKYGSPNDLVDVYGSQGQYMGRKRVADAFPKTLSGFGDATSDVCSTVTNPITQTLTSGISGLLNAFTGNGGTAVNAGEQAFNRNCLNNDAVQWGLQHPGQPNPYVTSGAVAGPAQSSFFPSLTAPFSTATMFSDWRVWVGVGVAALGLGYIFKK